MLLKLTSRWPTHSSFLSFLFLEFLFHPLHSLDENLRRPDLPFRQVLDLADVHVRIFAADLAESVEEAGLGLRSNIRVDPQPEFRVHLRNPLNQVGFQRVQIFQVFRLQFFSVIDSVFTLHFALIFNLITQASR